MTTSDALPYLEKLPLFAGLPHHVLGALAGKMVGRTLEKDAVLFRRGDPATAVYVVQTGWVKVVAEGHHRETEEVVLNKLGPGEIIGEVALLDGDNRTATVVALTPVALYELKRDAFMNVLKMNPQLALDVMRNLAVRLRFTNIYLERAIEIAQQITRGDYSVAMTEIRSTQTDGIETDESRADAMLSAFFEMVRQVKEREDALKEQVQSLTISIDREKQARDVEALTESTFFGNLKAQVSQTRKLRRIRQTGNLSPEDIARQLGEDEDDEAPALTSDD